MRPQCGGDLPASACGYSPPVCSRPASPRSRSSSCTCPGDGGKAAATDPPARPAGAWGVSQPGYREIDAPLATALRRLPLRVTLPVAAGQPAGVYAGVRGIRVRYGSGSHYGVFLLTVSNRKYGLRARRIRALALGCRSCSDNRLIRLTPAPGGARSRWAAARARSRGGRAAARSRCAGLPRRSRSRAPSRPPVPSPALTRRFSRS